MTSLGLKDLPLSDIDDESLGLKEYAGSLSDFIQQCETPLTIALQGDWGSGKTSLMNIIKASLPADKIKSVWFNTWQYSQFDMQGDLAISLISHFVDEISKDQNNKLKSMLGRLSKFSKLGKAITVAGAGFVGMGEVAKNAVEQFGNGNEFDPAMQIKKLKDDLEVMVQEKLQKENKERIVVFVDDIDRLLPEKAVELLEVFKLFLDIPSCVYVLACDYHVVSQGLRKKFGVGSDELKGKSFFDKIIQLPFNMPIGQYSVLNYIKKLLDRISVSYEEEDIALYANMLDYSIGFNPRGIKRVFNSLLLLSLVAKRKNLFDIKGDSATQSEKQKIMFGALCLQIAYEPVYRLLQKNKTLINDDFFEALTDEKILSTDDRFSEIRIELKDDSGHNLRKLSQFMAAFVDSVQLKSDEDRSKLSFQEIETLSQILMFSSLTSTDGATASVEVDAERYKNRKMLQSFHQDLNVKYSVELEKINTQFRFYQARNQMEAQIFIPIGYQEYDFQVCFVFNEKESQILGWAPNQLKRQKGQEWLNNYCLDLFPDAAYDHKSNFFGKLYRKEFSDSMPREMREQQYKELVMRVMDAIIPKMVADVASGV